MPAPKKNESKQDYLKRCTQHGIEVEGRKPEQAFAICNSLWNEAKGKHGADDSITLTAPLELKKTEDNKRSFLIAAYTGRAIDRWYGSLVFDVNGMKAKEKIPILREHYRDRVVGVGSKAWAENGEFYVSGLFSDVTKDAQEILELADEGFPWQASVGIWPKKVSYLKTAKDKATINGREITGPAEIWHESLVGEVSVVSLGADDNTAVIGLSQEDKKLFNEIINKKEVQIMADEITLAVLEKEAPELLSEIQEKSRAEGYAAGQADERARVVEILKAEGDQALTLQAIEDGTDAPAIYKAFYEAEKKKRADALKDMANSAPEPAGQDEPPEPKAKDTRPPDVQVSEKALELSKTENMDITDATNKILVDNPDLARAYYATFSMQ